MLGHTECSNSAEAEAETYSSTITSSSTTTTTTISVARNKKKSKNRRRFSDEQIKSLESMFETEWRLEPRKKAEAAHELGLQPRQLAIWFQNKRARWKAKQLQRDFNALRADYSALASRFEALKEEKQALLIQLQKLNDPVQEAGDQNGCCREVKLSANNSMDRESDSGETMKCEAEVKPSPSMERSEQVVGVVSDEDSSMKAEFFGLQGQPNLLNFDDQNGDASLASPEDWGRFESDDLLGQSGSGYQWWDFWS